MAVKEIQDELTDKGVIINPEKVATGKNGDKLLKSDGWRYVQNIEFDVSVGVDETRKNNGNGELKVFGVFTVGGGVNEENKMQNQNRIKFHIPVAFSTTKTPEEYKQK